MDQKWPTLNKVEYHRDVQTSTEQSNLDGATNRTASKQIILAEKWHTRAKTEQHISRTVTLPLCDNMFLKLA